MLQHVSINHGRTQIGMPEQFLHRPDIAATFQQMSRKAVTGRVRRDYLAEVVCFATCLIAPCTAMTLIGVFVRPLRHPAQTQIFSHALVMRPVELW